MSDPLRVLVTGASGFLGRALLEDLVSEGFAVTGVSRRPQQRGGGVCWRTCDLTTFGGHVGLVEGNDVVVNGAAQTWNAAAAENSVDYIRINRDAALSLFLAAQRSDVRVFIQVSSTGVYGRGAGVLDETSLCKPENAYERSKLEAEERLREVAGLGKTRLVVVRPSNVFGENHPQRKLLTWLRAVKAGRAILATDATRRWVNYVYLRDVTRAICQLARTLATDEAVPVPDVITLNDPATSRRFFEESVLALGMRKRAMVVPPGVLVLAGQICDAVAFLTRKPLPMTRGKAYELTNRQIFAADRAAQACPGFPWFGLREGLRRTADYYQALGEL